MKGLNKDALIKILEVKNNDVYLESDIGAIFQVFGDDYYVSKDTGKWELTKKNENFHIA